MTDPPKSDRRLSDGELLGLHLGGDHQAFAALMERYRRELYAFLYHLTGDSTVAEDAFQEAFLQVHLSAAAFDQTRPFKPWLFTIAANKGRDAMRRRLRRSAAPLDATVAGQDQRTTYADLMPAEIPAPDESLMNLETRRAVETIIARMPENLRAVLLLCYFNELPYKDVADILNVPLGTVKSRLHGAVKHFARQWQATAKRSGHDHEQE
ncbi:MAG TPA: sigma-70 family RNA polymerase sigma factor [Phycisphaerae bacterium]|nr:sigma-70 family RNA polymerase sigma factor [Phycisphaerae bacterium]